jgi:hypothetical protein
LKYNSKKKTKKHEKGDKYDTRQPKFTQMAPSHGVFIPGSMQKYNLVPTSSTSSSSLGLGLAGSLGLGSSQAHHSSVQAPSQDSRTVPFHQQHHTDVQPFETGPTGDSVSLPPPSREGRREKH